MAKRTLSEVSAYALTTAIALMAYGMVIAATL